VGQAEPGFVSEDIVPTVRFQMAYDAAANELSKQDNTLTNLRNRANGILSIAALITSFASGLGFLKNKAIPSWLTIIVLCIMIAIGALVMFILWPIEWYFCPDPRKILVEPGADDDAVRESLAKGMISGSEVNRGKLAHRAFCYQGAIVLLLAETAFVVYASVRFG
jgi:hypothetical protein